ncbi:MAG: LytTR family transcriptional regulator [Clostridia bacterium]|nr:LytTR family transcriptional regulator [Clostridia bacterium]
MIKILVEESNNFDEVEVIIKCKQCDDEILSMISRIKMQDDKVMATLENRTFIIRPKDILYFESVDKKTFIYTNDRVYETDLKLYEVEMRWQDFFRATKSTVVNISKIKNIKQNYNSVIDLEMENGERLKVSRQYAPILKKRLGM